MNISEKTSKVLHILLLIFLLLAFRSWHLSVIQKDTLLKESRKPQRKTILLPANRGTIRDRFSLPLALNKIRYDATIYYAHIRQIPFFSWGIDEQGNKVKYFPRKDYIKNLSLLLGKELDILPQKIEDLIHAKASLLPHAPFVIKENITEKQYARLKMLERTWTGLHAQIHSERFYPQKKTACNVLGYMGSINQKEYISIVQQIKQLQEFLETDNQKELFEKGFKSQEEALSRLQELKERAYTINDLIGKDGLENFFEEKLRGFYGKKVFEIDINGNFLKELPETKKPSSGESLTTSISYELQEFAESLLAEDEKSREERSSLPTPWIKGGAIVAMDPLTGEVIALASYPRFDPNDFIPSSNPQIKEKKQKNIHHWLETPYYIENIWKGKEPFSREIYNTTKKQFCYEQMFLHWDLFLDLLLSKHSLARIAFDTIETIQQAILIQENLETLLFLSHQKNALYLIDILFPKEEGHIPCAKIPEKTKQEILASLQEHTTDIHALKKNLASFLASIPNNLDKLFVIDLCRIAIYSPAFSDDLIKKIGSHTLSDYWSFSKTILIAKESLKKELYPLFLHHSFKLWRDENQKDFLEQKREEEKEKKLFLKPYTDYLDEQGKLLFEEFWQTYQYDLLTSLFKGVPASGLSKECEPYLPFLLTKQKNLVIDPHFNHLSYEETFSLFKTVRTLSELDRPLFGIYPRLSSKEPLLLEKHLASCFYPSHSFGFVKSQAFRQAAPLGSIFKLVTAYSALKQKYLSLPEDIIPTKKSLNPLWIIDQSDPSSHNIGYTIDGKPIPKFYKGGKLPSSSHKNMGSLDLVSALEQSSNAYFAFLAADFLQSPQNLLEDAKTFDFGKKTNISLPGEFPGHLPEDIQTNRTGLYSFSIGQHSLIATPLQTASMLCALANGGTLFQPKILKKEKEKTSTTIFLPPPIQHTLLEAMQKVVHGEKGNARACGIKKLQKNPTLLQEYQQLHTQFIGKTSTAEIMFSSDMLPSGKAQKYKHIWFGSISFKEEKIPELVVVVYLRFGAHGKEAAPLAAQMIKKYREILQKHENKQSASLDKTF